MQINQTLFKASWQSWVSNDNRPRAGPYWMQWLWTVLFAAAIAVVFTVIGFLAFGSGEGAWRNIPGWFYWYGKNFVVSLTISVAIHLLFDLGRATVAKPTSMAKWPGWQRTVYFAGVPLLGVALAWPLGMALVGLNVLQWFDNSDGRNAVAGSVLLAVLATFLLHNWFGTKAAQAEAERRATEAQLRLLQGQIEPHFLFNTLANVQSLMDHDLPKAQQMLSSFTDYLRASLGSLRNESSTLGHELQLARSYLELLQGRMEDRLRFDITAEPALLQQPLPPLLLQPLVENAVVHGLEPSINGGHVQVTARVVGQQLVLEVHDDGRGLNAPPRSGAPIAARSGVTTAARSSVTSAARNGAQGHGMALQNIRERLLAQYGSSARLEVEAAQPGTRARITLPLQTGTP